MSQPTRLTLADAVALGLLPQESDEVRAIRQRQDTTLEGDFRARLRALEEQLAALAVADNARQAASDREGGDS